MRASDWWKSKVFWTSIAGIIGTGLMWRAGQITPQEALAAIWAALQTIWMRDTVATQGDKVAAATAAATAASAVIAAETSRRDVG